MRRRLSGDGIVFAPEAADHTGAGSQSAAHLFLWFIVTQVQHRQLRERLEDTKQVEVYYNKLLKKTVPKWKLKFGMGSNPNSVPKLVF